MPEITCPECEGDGIVKYICSVCSGSGEGMAEGATCWRCKGTGEIKETCDTCDGRGHIEKEEDFEETEY